MDSDGENRIMSKPRVGVVIPNWNGAHFLDDCLGSLREQDYANTTVLVVDNASTDGSRELIASRFAEVMLYRCDHNLGFTGACNLGANLLFSQGAKYVLLLNNDTEADRNLISALVSVAEADPRIGAVSPLIAYYDEPKHLWYGGGEVDLSSGVTRHVTEQNFLPGALPRATDWANGCAFFVSAAAWNAAGELSPEYFASYEDTDLSLRIRRAGFLVYVTGMTRLRHKVSSTWGNKGQFYFYTARNRLLFLRRYGEPHAWLRWSLRMFLGSAWYAIICLARRDRPGFLRRVFEFFGVTAFMLGQRGKAPRLIYRFGSTTIDD
jgi:GT2 family glycosyltransferase